LKLLFDENLSPELVRALEAEYPASSHVHRVGLGRALDDEVWRYAGEHGFLIVTKDSDFHERSLLRGSPPKVVWLRLGNCSTREIQELLRHHVQSVRDLATDPDRGYLILP
jgi:predicted nuclease of predicted toxin-antitoxin system